MKKIIIIAPGAAITGGPEALHQLAFKIHKLTKCIVGIYYNGIVKDEVISHYYEKYKIDRVLEIPSDCSAVIIPEVIDPLSIYLENANIKKYVWWLAANRIFPMKSYKGFRHLFQSNYAMIRLGNLGFNGNLLSDYLSIDHNNVNLDFKNKENIVLYNGSKSSLMASRLLMLNPRLNLIAIRGFDKIQLIKLFEKAKVYIDFGPHPGKDRLPREAVLKGCVVITNTRGSAGNELDVPIIEKYKIKNEDPATVNQLINEIFKDYKSNIINFSNYINIIQNEEKVFNCEINNLVNDIDKIIGDNLEAFDMNKVDEEILNLQNNIMNLESRSNMLANEIEYLFINKNFRFLLRNDIRKIYKKIKTIFNR